MRALGLTGIAIGLAIGLAAFDAGPARADRNAFGLRGGVTDDPDTLFMGGHVAIHPRSVRRLRIEPSLELGFGDNSDFITIRANLNFKIMFPISRDAAFYPLLGPNLYYVNPDNRDDYSDFGLNLGAGFAFSGFAFDLIVGVPNDIPDVTFTFSYTFW